MRILGFLLFLLVAVPMGVLIALPATKPAVAQQIDDDDGGRGFLTRQIEGLLSGTGREVRINGFQGALSSRASIASIQISDDDGVWLTINDAVLDWNRSALLRRRLEVEALTAAEVILERPPLPADNADAPEPTAGGFSIPELPVAIQIDQLAVDRVVLGEPVIGQPVELTVAGSAALEGGSLDARIEAERVDGRQGTFRIVSAFAPQTGVLTVDVALQEEAGGLAATLLNLPGEPAVDLTVAGQGPLNDFTATIDLDTDGEDRLGGTFELLAGDEGAGGPTRRFELALDGDVLPLIAPDYREFFGPDVALRVAGAREPSGRTVIEALDVQAASLELAGEAVIDADNLPRSFDLRLVLDSPDGPVRLPVGTDLLLETANLSATFDAEDGERWTLEGEVQALDTPSADIRTLTLDGGGTISRADGERSVTAVVDAALRGLALESPGLQNALGQDLDAALDVVWTEGSPVQINRADVTGEGYGIDATGQLSRGDETVGPELLLNAAARFEDLSRLSTLAGTPLSGSAEVDLDGTLATVGGAFDLRLQGAGTDLGVGIAAVDDLIGGEATILLNAARNEGGTTLRNAELRTEALSLDASGIVGAESANLTATAALDDVARLVPQLEGPARFEVQANRANDRWRVTGDAAAPAETTATLFVIAPDDGPVAVDFVADVGELGVLVPALPGAANLTGRAVQSEDGWQVNLDATAPNGIAATVSAAVPPAGAITADYRATVADVGAFTELLSGEAVLSGAARLEDGNLTAGASLDGPEGITAQIDADLPAEGAPRITYRADVPDVGTFTEALDGAATLDGTATRDGEAWVTEAALSGPAGADLRARARIEGADIEASLDGRIARPEEIREGLPGPLDVTAEVSRVDGTLAADARIDTPDGDRLTFEGTLPPEGQGDAEVAFDLFVAEPERFLNGLPGPLEATGTGTRSADGVWTANVDASAADGSVVDVEARIDPAATDGFVRFDARVADLGRFVEQLPGEATAQGTAEQSEDGWRIDADVALADGSTVNAQGLYGTGGTLGAITFDAAIADLGKFVPQLEGPATAQGTVEQVPEGLELDVEAALADGSTASVEGLFGLNGARGAIDFDARVADLGRFVPQLPGDATAQGTVTQIEDGYALDVTAALADGSRLTANGAYDTAEGQFGTIEFDARLADLGRLVPQLPGEATARGTVEQVEVGYRIDVDAALADGSRASVDGLYATAPGQFGTVRFDARLADLGRFVPQAPGPVTAEGVVEQVPEGFRIDVDAALADGSTLTADGTYATAGGQFGTITFDARVADLGKFVPQLPGAATARGTVEQVPAGFDLDVAASLADGSTLTASGVYATDPARTGTIRFDARLAETGRFAPQLRGPTTASGTATGSGRDFVVDAAISAPQGIAATVRANTAEPVTVDFDATVANVAAFVPQLQGAARAVGRAVLTEAGVRLDVDATGPGGLTADVNGTLGATGADALRIAGAVPLQLANPFIQPRALAGTARYDLTVNGAAELSNLSGTVTFADARLAVPRQRLSVEGIDGAIRLSGGAAQFNLTGNAINPEGGGGTIAVGGSIALASLVADLSIRADDLVLRDPLLYETVLDIDLSVTGPLRGGGRIAGTVIVGETEVRIGETSFSGTGAIPYIRHVGDTVAVEATRERARIAAEPADFGVNRDGTPRRNAFALDINVIAERRIFIRGRGLDAELGGSLQLAGTTGNIIPLGQFDLIRGRFDILGRRLELTEGSISLQGDFNAVVRLVAETETDAGTVAVVIQGPIREPEIDFTSSSGLPDDEILAQLIFGRGLQTLTPFQAARLASAVATLSGRGGGFLGDLREGAGLDDLDFTTSDDGTAAVRAGRYLTENIYTDVTVDADGNAEIELNLDITDNIQARGSISADGETGIGIFYERDY